MPKSKQFVDTSDSDEQKNSASDEEKAKTSTSTKSKSKNTNNKDNPPAKRVKPNDKADGDGVLSTAGPNGERLYELSRLRYISVSQFKVTINADNHLDKLVQALNMAFRMHMNTTGEVCKCCLF
ncbi:unnamed protein product [Rotaria sp. Silwood1]|nr:unnamed protein product [Rotaria sp. Silwood1]